MLAAAFVALAGASTAHAKAPVRDYARHVTVVDGSATFVPGEVVVRFRASASQAARQAALASQGAKVAKRLVVPDAVLAKLPPGSDRKSVV